MSDRSPPVILIGPDASRHRGGIAQFTSRLAYELSTFSRISYFSWEELYPRLLFSRSFRREKLAFPQIQARHTLHFTKPWTWFQLADEIARSAPNEILVTWSHPIHAPIYLSLVRALRKSSRARITLICHNVEPHESFVFSTRLTQKVFTAVDRVMVHSAQELEKFRRLNLETPCEKLFMPLFDFFPSCDIEDSPEEGKEILFFGCIREYKGLDTLLRALPFLRQETQNIRLRIVGEPFFQTSARFFPSRKRNYPNSLHVLAEQLGVQDLVHFDFRYVPDEEVAAVFSRAQVVVYPFHSCSGSASLSIALVLGKPVVATRVGSLADSVLEGVNGRLVEPGDAAGLARAISELFRDLPSAAAVQNSVKHLGWREYALQLLANRSEELEKKYA